MTRYKITLIALDRSMRTTITRQPSRDAAIEKATRAYPGCKVEEIEALQDGMTRDNSYLARSVLSDAARDASSRAKADRHTRCLNRLLDALTPEGDGTTDLAKRIGSTTASVRKWAVELEAKGLAAREIEDGRRITVRRVEA